MEKKFRLRSGADFRKTRQQGHSWVHPLMVLYVFPNSLEHSRFGFSVNRRLGRAVVRNRIKRRMREAARRWKDEIKDGWDLVFVARSPISEATFHSIKHAMEILLRRACLFKADRPELCPCARMAGAESEN
jgi:ribonuclease P protein component